MINIPIYLKHCTRIKKELENAIILQVSCNCGCSRFFIFKNILDTEEEHAISAYENRLCTWGNIESYTDSVTKNRYLVKKNIFGKIPDKIPISEIRDMKRTQIIKVKCIECGEEIIIYDSRYYGYNAIMIDKHDSSVNKEYQYVLISKKAMEVEIKIRNELTYKEFCEETGKSSINEYANAFSEIEIYEIKDGKKKKIFEEETA